MATTLSQEELAALFAEADASFSDLGYGTLPAVLDTSCVRTGLHYQLSNGSPPASVTTAQDGSVHLFMEYDTLVETQRKLTKFARDLGVTTAELTRILNEDWLPHIDVVKIPPGLRQVDRRAVEVRGCDADDYPAAALAALLSPCILLTHNYTDFAALGVRTESQGVDAVLAMVDLKIGRMHMRAVVLLPEAPVRIAGATVKWASERFGPVTWVILGVIAIGGICWYRKQLPERRERIKEVALDIGTRLMDEYEKATTEVQQARVQLHACVVPSPKHRTPVSAILRELAMSEESLSAQQLADLLDPPLRPPVAEIRAYLRANDKTLFAQVRRGGFALGRHYQLPEPVAPASGSLS
jgi:hypothetical protein